MQWEQVNSILSSPIAYHRIFATISGGALQGLFLSQIFYWTPRTKDPNGWFYKSQTEWEQETGLTRYEQETAREKLKAKGLLQEKKGGIPCRLFYRLNVEKFLQEVARATKAEIPNAETEPNSEVGEKQQTSLRQSNKQACSKATNKVVAMPQSNTESTAKNSEIINTPPTPIKPKEAGEKVQPGKKHKSITEQSCYSSSRPTKEAIADVSKVLRELRLNPEDWMGRICKWWANAQGALAYLKQSIAEGWCKDPVALLTVALKEGRKPTSAPSSKSSIPEESNPPTAEQYAQLEQAKQLCQIHDYFFSNLEGITKVVLLGGREQMPWREFFEKQVRQSQ